MKLKMFLVGILSLSAGFAFGSESDGKVIEYFGHYYHDSFAFSVENQTGRPACATYGGTSGRYIVDTRTEKGRVIVSMVMAAKASGSKLYVKGINTCTYYGDSEDVSFVKAY